MRRATVSLVQQDYCRTFSLSGGIRCFHSYEDLSKEKKRGGHTLSVVTFLQSL